MTKLQRATVESHAATLSHKQTVHNMASSECDDNLADRQTDRQMG